MKDCDRSMCKITRKFASVRTTKVAFLVLMLAALLGSATAATEKVIYGFGFPAKGSGPEGSFIFDSQGNLYGTTWGGGPHNVGTVFELTPGASGWTEKVLYSFRGGTDGAYPFTGAGLVMDSAGNLYGTTLEGGNSTCGGGCGTVFELKPIASGWTESVIYAFKGGSDGESPVSGLTLDAAGNLYGTIPSGGAFSYGAIFELQYSGSSWSKGVLYSFRSGADGSTPEAGLIFDASGNLYGTTERGGSPREYGTVFELERVSHGWKESVLYAFKGGSDGYSPEAVLSFDSAGNLYGTTSSGMVFELTPGAGGAWSKSTVYQLVATSNVQTGVILDAPGNLYGETFADGVFELSFVDGVWTKTTLYNTTQSDGNLVFDTAGHLYGAAFYGGTTGLGSVFELTSSSGVWTESNIYSFPASAGAEPFGGLIFDGAGNLYGTTETGGTYNLGSVFELTPNGSGWTEKVLHSFKGGNDGKYPFSPLTFDSAGNLYGTTSAGGAHNGGTVFELSPNGMGGWANTSIYAFCALTNCTDGEMENSDIAGLTLDAAGNIYGTTVNGGAYKAGTLFKLTHSASAWTETVLSSFCRCPNGGEPLGGVIFDSAGNLYGTTYVGGGTWGTVYEFNVTTNTKTVLYEFRGPQYNDGAYPEGNLIFDTAGNLYGTTDSGGTADNGTVFELQPTGSGSWTEIVLHSFTGKPDGAGPAAGVIFDTAGNLYGTTIGGGASEYGTVFELTPTSGTWTETVLYTFTDGADGAIPWAGLVLDSSGNLYGETYWPTTDNNGAVFEVTP
jgi:uncharacterized repeat protein (TIGR03803 family)